MKGQLHLVLLPVFLSVLFAADAKSPLPIGTSLPPIFVTGTTITDTCGLALGAIDITPSGGVPPYTFAWSNGATTEDISNLLGGVYYVTVTDAVGGTKIESFTVENITNTAAVFGVYYDALIEELNTSCTAPYNGSIAFENIVPTNLPFVWNWSNGDTTPYSLGLPGGWHHVTITLGNCTPNIHNGPTGIHLLDDLNIPEISGMATNASCGLANGSIDQTVTQGTPPFTFAWNTGADTEDLSGLLPGIYNVTVTDAEGCTSTASYSLTDVVPFTISGIATPNTSDPPNGSVDITLDPPDSYTYAWSNGENTEDISGLAAGTYTVTVTLSNGCTQTASFTVDDNFVPMSVTGVTVTDTCDLALGAIDITPSGGVPPYTFAWSNGATTEDLSNLLGGVYMVTVTDAVGGTQVESFTVGNITNGVPLWVYYYHHFYTTKNTSCTAPYNGSITFDTIVNNLPFIWNWSNGATTTNISDLAAGFYNLTVTLGSCIIPHSQNDFEILDSLNLPEISGTATNASCGLANGSIDLTASDGEPPYTYAWSNGATTEDIDNLAPGFYNVTVTGANGCTAVGNWHILDSPAFSVSGTATPNTSDPPNGSVDITLDPPDSYTYAWSNGASTEDISGLAAGTFTVTVTLANGCTQTASFTVDDNFVPLSVTGVTVTDTCGLGLGSVDITPTGGVPPYTFAWSNGATTEDISNLLGGVYTVTVTDAVGGTQATSFVVDNITFISGVDFNYYYEFIGIYHNTTCMAPPNGGMYTMPLTTLPFMWNWSNGVTTPNNLGLAAGSYYLTVTLGVCVNIWPSPFTVEDIPDLPELAATQEDALCGLSNGSIDLTASDGEPPYTYAWSNGATTEDIDNLAPGFYNVTVTGANGCTAVGNWHILDSPAFSVSGTATPNTSDPPNGSVDITPDPPDSYTYAWSNGASTEDISGLAAGTYTVTVTDPEGCTATSSFVVEDFNPPPMVLTAVINQDTCELGYGSIDLSVSGGTPPFMFTWSNGAPSEDISGLVGGTNYTVTVEDANGVQEIGSFFVPNFVNMWPPNFQGIYTFTGSSNSVCVGTPNGYIDFTPLTSLPYTWVWSNGVIGEDNFMLAAGDYFATVTLGSCMFDHTLTILLLPDAPSIDYTTINASCGLSNGMIDLTTTEGVPPYVFEWSNGATTEDINNLASGLYTVTVTGANGCTSVETIFVNDNPTFSFTGNTIPNSNCGMPNGAIDITVNPPGTYNYNWSNGANTEDINGLGSGTYTVTVTDPGGCSNESAFTVGENIIQTSASVTSLTATCGLPNGTVNLSLNGGVPLFTFEWSNGATTEDLAGVPGGMYTVTVTGSNGCTATATATVADTDISIALGGNMSPNTACVGANGSINTTVSPFGSYTYAWDNGASTPSLSPVPGGTYALTVTVGTCTTSASFTVLDLPEALLLGAQPSPATCGGSDGGVDLTVLAGQPPLAFTWDNGAGTEDLTGVPAGIYTVTVIATGTGCTATATALVGNSGNGADTTAVYTTTCDPNGVGVTEQLFTNQNGCDSLVITTVTLLQSDTTYLSGTSCDPNGVGTFEQTLTNQGGCDSLVITTVTLLQSDTTYLSGTSCNPANVGTFEQNLTNQLGCDSLVVMTVTFAAADTTSIALASCDPNGIGTFEQNLTNQYGCDSLVVTTISLLQSDTVQRFDTSCDPSDVGVTVQNLTNQYGCDSLVVTTVTFAAADTTAISGTTCDPNGVGMTEQLLTNQQGCDSVVITTISLLQSDTTYLSGTSCNPANVGTFEQNLTNQFGCDSLVITTIAFSEADTTAIAGTSCDPNGVGTFEQTFMNQYGCDSVVITSITLLQSDTVQLYDTSCNPSDVGTFAQTLTNQFGCDSLVVTTITFAEADTTAIVGTTCDTNGVGFTEQLFTNANGCDSLVITTVTLLPSASTSLASTTCDPSQAGIFIENLLTWQGCDSTVTTTVTLLPSATTTLASTTCDPMQAGVFTENLSTWQGCDSIVTTTVTLIPSATTSLTSTTCDPTQAGVFTENLLTWQGCDSVVTTTVTLLPSETTSLTSTTCDPTQAGVFVQNFTTWQGCDSTVTTTVTLLPSATTSLNSTTCDPTQAGVFVQNLMTWQGCDSTVTTTVAWTPPPALTLSASDFNGYGISCEGASDGWAQASANGSPPLSYGWDNGSILPLLEGLSPGSYAVTVTDANGCTSVGSVTLTGPEGLSVALSVNALDCFDGNSGAINATAMGGVPPYSYSLNPTGTGGGAPQPSGTFGGLGAGAYEITVQDANGCSATELVAINAPVPLSVELGDDVFLELGDGTALSALTNVPLDSLAQVDWTGLGNVECPGCPAQQVFPLVTTAYTVTVVDGQGCVASDGVTVYVDRRKSVYVPNAFSPNGDGVNDLLQVFAKEGQVRKVRSFLVFDRWGESVFRYFDFQPNDPAFGWDGTHRGQPLNTAVFVWFAEVEFVDGTAELFEGDVVLMR
ncbi:MAG: T9SS type B sorting domain-containing protein [Bacteroidetes bacterium]|nr:T9SS type B sorting domain-containing protein [Bacteroidota bacterium]